MRLLLVVRLPHRAVDDAVEAVLVPRAHPPLPLQPLVEADEAECVAAECLSQRQLRLNQEVITFAYEGVRVVVAAAALVLALAFALVLDLANVHQQAREPLGALIVAFLAPLLLLPHSLILTLLSLILLLPPPCCFPLFAF